MFTHPGTRFCPTQSIVSIAEGNKHSESQIAKSGVVIYPNPPLTNYVDDLQTRLEVVSKLVPQHEVQRAYVEFVKKLNEMCYETVAEQLVRPSRPASIASSVFSQNIPPIDRKNRIKSNNGANSTMRRLYKAAEGVRKHLSTISESSIGDGLLLPIKTVNQRNKLRILPRDDTMNRFHPNGISSSKSSRKIASVRKRKKRIEESSVEMVETEFNITKDSLRNSRIVVREQKQRITIRRNSKNGKSEDTQKNVMKAKKFTNNLTPKEMLPVQLKKKKTALSPFYDRLSNQRRSHPQTAPLFKF